MSGLTRQKQSNVSSGRGGRRPGAGRPKGSLDKGNAALRDMLASALQLEGGVEYLRRLARDEPKAFASLLGRLLPLQVTGADGRTLAQELAALNAHAHADD